MQRRSYITYLQLSELGDDFAPADVARLGAFPNELSSIQPIAQAFINEPTPEHQQALIAAIEDWDGDKAYDTKSGTTEWFDDGYLIVSAHPASGQETNAETGDEEIADKLLSLYNGEHEAGILQKAIEEKNFDGYQNEYVRYWRDSSGWAVYNPDGEPIAITETEYSSEALMVVLSQQAA